MGDNSPRWHSFLTDSIGGLTRRYRWGGRRYPRSRLRPSRTGCCTQDYRPTRSRPQAALVELRRIVQTFFGGSIDQAVTGLLRSHDVELDEDDLERLRRLIDKARKEGR